MTTWENRQMCEWMNGWWVGVDGGWVIGWMVIGWMDRWTGQWVDR